MNKIKVPKLPGESDDVTPHDAGQETAGDVV
jgi:hypothetical protein